MPTAASNAGLLIAWKAAHHDKNGKLIVRMASITEPAPLTCVRFSCIVRFAIDMLTYALVSLYHERRTEYAEANRNKEILERYRTGEPSPKNWFTAIIALTKLACPVCKRVETPW